MKIKDIALSAAAIGQRVVKAICVGEQEVWSAVKYIVFKDPVVEQICATNWGDGVGITEEQAAAVTRIGLVFQNNTDIEYFDELDKFENIESLGSNSSSSEGCFDGCTNLKTVSLPAKLTYIGYYVFRQCKLNRVIIPDNVTELGNGTFYGCVSLTSIVFNKALSRIDQACFRGCTSLNIDLDISNEITLVREAFHSSGVKSINLPNAVVIGDEAFNSCKSLTHIYNLGNVKTIPWGGFTSCSNLEYAEFPSSVTKIDNGALHGCSKIETLIVHATTPPTIVNKLFNHTLSSTMGIYVPDDSVEAYKNATNWSTYADRIKGFSVLYLTVIIPTDVVGEGFQVEYELHSDIYNKEFQPKWSIVDGSEYATINQNGYVSISENALVNDIVVRLENSLDSSLYVDSVVNITYFQNGIEYIKTDGRQYVDLGYFVNPATEFELDVCLEMNSNTQSGGNNALFGAKEDDYIYSANHGSGGAEYGNIFWWFYKAYGSGGNVSYATGQLLSIRTAIAAKYNLAGQYCAYYNGTVTYVDAPVHTFTTASLLLACGTNGAIYNRTNMIIYKMTIKENGEIVRMYTPAKIGDVNGLYEHITKTFHSSATGVNFIEPTE